MQFTKTSADLLIPDSAELPGAISRTTHLGIGAHPDDLEFMAYHGILECFQRDDRWFGGVTCTDGSGSARSGPYADCSDAQMISIRLREQQLAARVGQYGFMAQLGFSSGDAKEAARRTAIVDDLEKIIGESCPEIIYTHNPFDKHATHVGILLAVVEAIRRLPAVQRPQQLVGCEVWRDLDWLPDHLKVVQPLDAHQNLAGALNGVFDSQISGGKRYDLGVQGRRQANATYFDSHATDDHQMLSFAIDLTDLIRDDTLKVEDWMAGMVKAFSDEVLGAVGKLQD